MDGTPLPTAERERRFQEVVAAYLGDLEAGRPQDFRELLRRHPDLAEEIATFFAHQEQVACLAAPLRALVLAESTTADGSPPAGISAGRSARALPRSFGEYELLEEIAGGGMGVVYRARQKGLNRLVALKTIRDRGLISGADVQRFRAEAEMIASLDHPHIVPVYEVGEHEGQPYFVMKLIEGGSLADRLDRFGADPRSAARLAATVARAVHHAHQHAILHRDLKPSNILLDAEGLPHVTDFGLARRLETDAGLTRSGILVGTPGYMAPEQATGQKGVITTATDVYGLGAVLYALLTGQPPYRGETALDTLVQVKERDPEPPGRLNQGVDRDLEVICLKCLEKDPQRRYTSAAELADDLERSLAGEPIRARQVGMAGHLLRWCRRNRLATGLAATALSLLVAVAVVATLGYLQTKAALKLAKEEKELAVEKTAEAQRQHKRAEAFFGRALADISAFVLKLEGEEWALVSPVRKDAIRNAFLQYQLTSFRRLLEENSDDPMVRVETAWVHNHVGRVYCQQLGDHARAEKAYRMALAILEEREADFRAIPDYVWMLGESSTRLGWMLYSDGRSEEAAEAFRKEIAYVRWNAQLSPDVDACNRAVLALCLCPIVPLRDSDLAVELAAHAVALAPQRGDCWGRFGMARYRGGDWKGAIAALEKALELTRNEPCWNFFFLAMAHWQLGQKAEAHHWYEKGVEDMKANNRKGLKSAYINAEAAALLGEKQPPLPQAEEEFQRID